MQQFVTGRNQDVNPENDTPAALPFWVALAQLPGQYIRIIASPSVKLLRNEVGKARWSIVCIQILLLVVLTIALNMLGHLIPRAALHTVAGFEFDSFSLFRWLPAPFNGIAFILAAFLIGLGTAYPFSRLSKGRGRFVEHAYLLLLFTAPLVVLSGALLLIPAIGTWTYLIVGAVAVLFLYRMVLHVMTIMAAHDLSAGSATLIVLIIPMLLLLIALVAFTEGRLLEGLDVLDLPFTGGHKVKKRPMEEL